MTKEEVKQWLRNQIDSSIKIQDGTLIDLYYNKLYLRALKLSKINGQPVNPDNFKKGVLLFGFDPENKIFWCYGKIRVYLKENYSIVYSDRIKILKEVLNEYDEYKGYNVYS